MSTYTVKFEVTPPVDATKEQVEAWVRYCLGDLCGIDLANPLSNHDLSANYVEVE